MKTLVLLVSLLFVCPNDNVASLQTNRFDLPQNVWLSSLAFGNGAFVGTGVTVTNEGGDLAPILFRSFAGEVWTTNAAPARFTSLQFDGAFFWAVSPADLWKSTDGVAWTKISQFATALNSPTLRVNGSRMMAFDGCGKVNVSTNGGLSWLFHQNPSQCGAIYGEIVGDVLLTAEPGVPNGFALSTNATTWDTFLPFDSSVSAMVSGNGLFTAFIYHDFNQPLGLRTSEDGRNWSPETTMNFPVPFKIREVQVWRSNGWYFLAVDDSEVGINHLFASRDLQEWQQVWQISGPDYNMVFNFASVAFGNGSIIAAVRSGNIYTTSYVVRVGPFDAVAPVIDRQPRPSQVYLDSPAQFNVVAFGSEPLQFQWYKDGTLITGATNSVFTISQVTANDEGDYDVVVSNAADSVRSTKAHLTVTWLRLRNYAGLDVDVDPGTNVRIEFSPSPEGPWQTLTNITAPSRPFTWIDLESPGVTTRVYRAVKQ